MRKDTTDITQPLSIALDTSWYSSITLPRSACTCQEDSHMRGTFHWYLVLDELSDCSSEAAHMPGCMEAGVHLGAALQEGVLSHRRLTHHPSLHIT